MFKLGELICCEIVHHPPSQVIPTKATARAECGPLRIPLLVILQDVQWSAHAGDVREEQTSVVMFAGFC